MEKLKLYPEINVDNLQRMYDYLVQNKERISISFDMKFYRTEKNEHNKHECNSIGCLLGHGVGGLKIEDVFECKDNFGLIDFRQVSSELLGIKSEALWGYLFSSNWGRNVSVNYNTLESGLKRLETILNDKSFIITDEWKEYKNSNNYV